MALGLTQPLTEMNTRNVSWGGKVSSAYGRQTYHIHVQTVLKSGSLKFLEPSGPVQTCNGIAFFTNTEEFSFCYRNIQQASAYSKLRYTKVKLKCTVVQALRLCTGCTVHRGSRGIGKGKVHRCTGTAALYRLYGP